MSSATPFVVALMKLILVGVVFKLLTWLLGEIALKEPFNYVAKVVLAVGAVLAIIFILMGVFGISL